MHMSTKQQLLSETKPLPSNRNLALVLAFFALALAVADAIKHSVGYLNMQVLLVLPSHPQAFLGYVAEGLGASLAPAAIHIAVASCFKTQRTSRKRWNILLGWSIATAVLAVMRLLG
jgi:hypothetical protein